VLGCRCVAKMTNIEGKRYGENGEQWYPIYNQLVAESEANEANLVLKLVSNELVVERVTTRAKEL